MDITQLGRYEIRAELGRGGMAVVYLAHDPQFQRDVALKVLPREFSHSEMFRERFAREARVIAALEHPAIVPVYDFGSDQGYSFFVMRYMGGGSLRERMRAGRLQLHEMLSIVDRIAAALDLAHARGIVHRDLKPANILFDQQGNAYLSDFGIVRLMEDTANLTGTGFIGTAAYTSPEQVQGAAGVDGRSDIYTLGIMIYEMLTGRQPFLGDTPTKQMMAHVLQPVPDIGVARPDLPRAVREVVTRTLAKAPEDRYQTAGDLARALRAGFGAGADTGPTAAATAPRKTPPLPRSGLGRPVLLGGIALAVLAVVALGIFFVFFNNGGDDSAVAAATVTLAAGDAPTAAPASASTPSAPAGAATRPPAPVEGGNAAPPPSPSPSPQPSPTLDSGGGDALLAEARRGAFAGTTVTLLGTFDVSEAFSLATFADETGIDIRYEGSSDFETLIQARVDAGDPPDIGVHPQPGLLRDLALQGAVIDPSTFLGLPFLERQYAPGWLADATLGGQIAGVWVRSSIKSLVWYPKDDFENAGYRIPETWDDLLALSDQIVADGGVPWCIGLASASATGWVATDWIEDILLRTQPPAVFDAWTTGELPFDSPEVRNAVEMMAAIWKNPDYVRDGTAGIVRTPFDTAANGLFSNPPSCWLHRQASFMPEFFPAGTEIGRDVDFFYFPMIDPEQGRPLLMAGDIAAIYNDRPEVRAVMAYLATGESARAYMAAGGYLSPHKDANLDWYTSDVDRRYAELLRSADVTRFDGSDLMPAAVGAGAFWREITEWVSGGDLDAALRAIDAAWPR